MSSILSSEYLFVSVPKCILIENHRLGLALRFLQLLVIVGLIRVYTIDKKWMNEYSDPAGFLSYSVDGIPETIKKHKDRDRKLCKTYHRFKYASAGKTFKPYGCADLLDGEDWMLGENSIFVPTYFTDKWTHQAAGADCDKLWSCCGKQWDEECDARYAWQQTGTYEDLEDATSMMGKPLCRCTAVRSFFVRGASGLQIGVVPYYNVTLPHGGSQMGTTTQVRDNILVMVESPPRAGTGGKAEPAGAAALLEQGVAAARGPRPGPEDRGGRQAPAAASRRHSGRRRRAVSLEVDSTGAVSGHRGALEPDELEEADEPPKPAEPEEDNETEGEDWWSRRRRQANASGGVRAQLEAKREEGQAEREARRMRRKAQRMRREAQSDEKQKAPVQAMATKPGNTTTDTTASAESKAGDATTTPAPAVIDSRGDVPVYFKPGEAVAMTLEDWLGMAVLFQGGALREAPRAGSSVLDGKNVAVPPNTVANSSLQHPTFRMTGVELTLQLNFQNKAAHRRRDHEGTFLSIAVVARPDWQSMPVLHNILPLDPMLGMAVAVKRNFYGVRVRFTSGGRFADVSYTAILATLSSFILYLQVPSMVIAALGLFLLGVSSDFYYYAANERMELRRMSMSYIARGLGFYSSFQGGKGGEDRASSVGRTRGRTREDLNAEVKALADAEQIGATDTGKMVDMLLDDYDVNKRGDLNAGELTQAACACDTITLENISLLIDESRRRAVFEKLFVPSLKVENTRAIALRARKLRLEQLALEATEAEAEEEGTEETEETGETGETGERGEGEGREDDEATQGQEQLQQPHNGDSEAGEQGSLAHLSRASQTRASRLAVARRRASGSAAGADETSG